VANVLVLLSLKNQQRSFFVLPLQTCLSIYLIGFVEEIFCTMKFQLYSFEILFVQW
jgi:hypothetical protein